MGGRTAVSGYERRGPKGTTTTVRHHKRRGLDPCRGARRIRRGWKHQRHGNPGRAVAWGLAGVLEIVAYVLFGITGVVLTTFGLFIAIVGTTMVKATRGDAK